MSGEHRVVIVVQNPTLAGALLAWLTPEGYEISVVTTFATGKELLARGAGLLIAEVKLGEHNGLHLALRARSAGIPAMVIGPRDPVLERDAHDLGVTYLRSVLHRQHVLTLVAAHFGASLPPNAGGPLEHDASWQFDTEPASLPLHSVVHPREILH